MGVISIIIGCVFLFVSFRYRKGSAAADWISVKGQIVNIKNITNWGGKRVYTPIVLFYTEQGQKLFFQGQDSQIPFYSLRQFVEVIYNPRNPQQAQIKNDSGGKFIGITFLILGIMMLILGCIGLILDLFLLISIFSQQ